MYYKKATLQYMFHVSGGMYIVSTYTYILLGSFIVYFLHYTVIVLCSTVCDIMQLNCIYFFKFNIIEIQKVISDSLYL